MGLYHRRLLGLYWILHTNLFRAAYPGDLSESNLIAISVSGSKTRSKSSASCSITVLIILQSRLM